MTDTPDYDDGPEAEDDPFEDLRRRIEAKLPPEQLAAIRAEVEEDQRQAVAAAHDWQARPAPDDWQARPASDVWRDAVHDGLHTVWRAVDERYEERPSKTRVTVRLDADVLRWFRDRGRGHQSFINAVLRAFMTASKAAR